VSESPGDSGFDLSRLERAIDALVADRDRLERALSTLHREVVVKDERIARLASELESATKSTAAACERIDSLVARLDHLDAVLAQAAEVERDPVARPASAHVGAQPS